MINRNLVSKIFSEIKKAPSWPGPYRDLFGYLRSVEGEDFGFAHEKNRELRNLLTYGISLRENVGDLFDVYKKSLLFDAPHYLDPYLLYLELKRDPERRFYQPRRSVLKPVVDALQALADDELDELFLSMPPRVGKLLADDTPVLTAEGWKKHGDLQVGDTVFNEKGESVKVLAVHPKHHTEYTVTFTDHTSVKCHGNHEWVVFDRRFMKTRVLETKEMYGHLENGPKEGRGHRYNFMLPLKAPIEGNEKELPVPPYTFGAWLGDGTNTLPRITIDKNDTAIIDAIMAEGYGHTHVYWHKTTGVPSYEFGNPLRQALHKIGLCMYKRTVQKYIPDEYFTASKAQRLELLAGLLDTDGTLRRSEGRYNYCTCDDTLKDGVVTLISTFGWRANVRLMPPHTSSFGIVGKKPCWVISFNPDIEIPCRLERKHLSELKKRRRVAIASIEKSEPERGNCITVEGGTYLVGETLQPTHNSSLMIFFMSWLLGRRPENPNLYCSYTDVITRAFYSGVLEILQDKDTYSWHDVFPTAKLVQTNAADETLNIDRRKHYPSLTCRSIDGTINGACDAQDGVIIADDLVSGIEEALSKDRLISKWGKVDNNLIPRGKGKTKYLWIGTRWSVLDPAAVRLNVLSTDEKYAGYRYKVINLPALNENDESNFDYPYGVGFDTLYYHRRRASFERNNDIASWDAQYMGEPIEREGTLFLPADFRYYNGELPDEEPDRVVLALDPAYGGGDFCAGAICCQYDDELYIPDVIYDDNDKTITLKLIVNAVRRYGINAIQIEANKSTMGYKDELERLLKEEGLKVNLTTKTAPPTTSKAARIFDKAPDIRECCVFLESGKRPRHYDAYMQNVYGFKVFAKNKHDDAPDSLAMLIDMVFRKSEKPVVFKRPF